MWGYEWMNEWVNDVAFCSCPGVKERPADVVWCFIYSLIGGRKGLCWCHYICLHSDRVYFPRCCSYSRKNVWKTSLKCSHYSVDDSRVSPSEMWLSGFERDVVHERSIRTCAYGCSISARLTYVILKGCREMFLCAAPPEAPAAQHNTGMYASWRISSHRKKCCKDRCLCIEMLLAQTHTHTHTH